MRVRGQLSKVCPQAESCLLWRPRDKSLMPRSHLKVERENTLWSYPLTSNIGTSPTTHTHIQNPFFFFFNRKLVLFCCKFQGSNSGHHVFMASTFYLVNQIPGSTLISSAVFIVPIYVLSPPRLSLLQKRPLFSDSLSLSLAVLAIVMSCRQTQRSWSPSSEERLD